jgi:hypothetical protein
MLHASPFGHVFCGSHCSPLLTIVSQQNGKLQSFLHPSVFIVFPSSQNSFAPIGLLPDCSKPSQQYFSDAEQVAVTHQSSPSHDHVYVQFAYTRPLNVHSEHAKLVPPVIKDPVLATY